MLPDRISNAGPLTYESGALSTALRDRPCKPFTNGWSLTERTALSLKGGHSVKQLPLFILDACNIIGERKY